MVKNKTRKLRGGNPLKVAILFSGRVKAYEYCLDDINKLRAKYSPTFFCSLNKKEYSPYIKKFSETFNIGSEQLNLEPTITPGWLEKIDVHPWNKRYNVYSTLYHNYKAFELLTKYQIKHKMKFDLILLYRADSQCNTPDILHLERPDDNTIYIPSLTNITNNMSSGNFHPEKWDRKYGIHCVMAYGNYESMNVYCNAVNEIQELHKKYNIAIHHEGILFIHLINKNIGLKQFKLNIILHPNRHKHNNNYDIYK